MVENVAEFWDRVEPKEKPKKRRKAQTRQAPPIPDTGWTAPKEFPNLSGEKVLGIDVETYDPELKENGPGWARGVGDVVGVSLATSERGWYFPFGHTVAREQNLDRERVVAWLQDTLSVRRDYVGTNLQYDIGWLRQIGVNVNHRYLFDVQNAEPLLDEFAPSYSLDKLAEKHLNEHKVSEQLYEWLSAAYGGKATAKAQGGNIHRAPPCLVGPYAEADATLPLRIMAKQRKELEAQELWELFMIETRLVPLLLNMRWRGVAVDLSRANAINDEWLTKEQNAQHALNELVQTQVDVWSSGSIANAFQRLNEPFPKTPKGAPSFTQHFLQSCQHNIAQHILAVRKYSKARGTFVQNYVVEKHVDGILHGSFHQLRRVTDEGGGMGTVSGRFSSSGPNLQNIPSRDEEIGPACRSMFVPFAEDRHWRRYDYSQIEYRLLVHYATGPGAAEARERFVNDPDTDYHEMVRQLIHEQTGVLLDRKPTKNINFGLAYGMGKKKLRNDLGLDKVTGDQLFAAYHTGAPFVQRTFNAVMNRAMTRGYIVTLLNRRARFDMWEPSDWTLRECIKPSLDRSEVAERVKRQQEIERANGNEVPRGGAQRAFGHKALNRLLQGGAADIMKKAMVDQLDAGVYDVTGVPVVTVHDELGFSDPGTRESDEAFKEAEHIMQNCVELRVPLTVDKEIGPSWGEVA